MAATLGAIRGFLHRFTDDWSQRGNTPGRLVTILDILEPRGLQG